MHRVGLVHCGGDIQAMDRASPLPAVQGRSARGQAEQAHTLAEAEPCSVAPHPLLAESEEGRKVGRVPARASLERAGRAAAQERPAPTCGRWSCGGLPPASLARPPHADAHQSSSRRLAPAADEGGVLVADGHQGLLDLSVAGGRPRRVVLARKPGADGLQRPVGAAPARVVKLVLRRGGRAGGGEVRRRWAVQAQVAGAWRAGGRRGGAGEMRRRICAACEARWVGQRWHSMPPAAGSSFPLV